MPGARNPFFSCEKTPNGYEKKRPGALGSRPDPGTKEESCLLMSLDFRSSTYKMNKKPRPASLTGTL